MINDRGALPYQIAPEHRARPLGLRRANPALTIGRVGVDRVPMIEVVQFRSLEPGPKLLILGAVHGNEVCGTIAIRDAVAAFEAGDRALARGTVSFVPVTNPVAHQQGTREGDRNLNRGFDPDGGDTGEVEDRIVAELAPLIAEHDVLVDLHSFKTAGEPFVFLGPPDNDGPLEPFDQAATEEAVALAVGPDRLMYGWLPTYAAGAVRREGGSVAYGIGTTEFARRHGTAAVTVECGQHDDPTAPAVARAAIDHALAVLNLEGETSTEALPRADREVELIELHEVHDRLDEGDRFTRRWRSFDRVEAGDTVAIRTDGTPIAASEAGYVVFPNEGTPVGREWFYLARFGDRQLNPGRIPAE